MRNLLRLIAAAMVVVWCSGTVGYAADAPAVEQTLPDPALFVGPPWPPPLPDVTSPWRQALTLFGSAKYKPGFAHFDYVNAKAPKGGQLKMAWPMTFDSLNTYILKGVKAPGMEMVFETLMEGSMDEPQSYYPLIAEAYRINKGEGWIEFRLNRAAKWQDGKPITVDDVIWSLDTIKKEGDPVYRLTFAPLAKAEKTGERTVKITFAKPMHREAPLLSVSLPILPKHYYATVPFNKTTLVPPVGSGPYKVGAVDAGRSIRFDRVTDYWGRNLAVNRGRYNFDRIRYDVYRDATVALQALKAGVYDFRQENISRNWATAYDTPAVRDGRLIKTVLPNKLPQGMQGFFYNLRRPALTDRRVREAIGLTMDYEWINKTLFYSAYTRNRSFFQYTPFEATGLPEGKELELLEKHRDQLPPELFSEIFHVPKTNADGQNRANLLKAQRLLNDAGYRIKDGRRIDPKTGAPLQVEFLLNQDTMQRPIAPMRKGLKRLGIESTVRIVDDAQYQRRVETRDFDIISGWYNYGVFYPGVEQSNYWHSAQADIEGSNNVSGLKNPAVDAALEQIAIANTLDELEPAARALDRILLWEHVVIPHWHNIGLRVAYWDKFGLPKKAPDYGLAIDSWWMKGK